MKKNKLLKRNFRASFFFKEKNLGELIKKKKEESALTKKN